MRIVKRNNREVLESWAGQEQEHAVCGNVSYDEEVLFSYTTAVAKLFPEKKIALVTNQYYSVSTQRHKNEAWLTAGREGYKTIQVLDFMGRDHEKNIGEMIRELKRNVVQFDRSRNVWTARGCIAWSKQECNNLRMYCAAFEQKVPCLLGLELSKDLSYVKKRFVNRRSGTGELFVSRAVADRGVENLTAKDLMKYRNAELRREIIDRVGIERVCNELGAEVMDRQGDYELVLLDLRDGNKRVYLKMLNPSIGVWHLEGVHPACMSVQDALNYRFYGDDMFIGILEQAEQETTSENGQQRLTDWRRRAELRRNPEERKIKNVMDWEPVQLT